MLEQQQQAYKVAGVDESEPAVDLRKRKARDGEEVSDLQSEEVDTAKRL